MTIIDKALRYNNTTPKSVPTSKENTIDLFKSNETEKTLDTSTFSKILAIYSRNEETGNLLNIEEKCSCQFENYWSQFHDSFKQDAVIDDPIKDQNEELQIYILGGDLVEKLTYKKVSAVKIYEYAKPGENQIRGIITNTDNEDEFNCWFIFHILDQCRLSNNCEPIFNRSVPYHELVADYFAANLKNTVHDDEWDEKGRLYFIKRVKYFTDRYLKIECILPAFPCKSSNGNKVYGTLPDKGEELALKRLIKATYEVRKFYPPGMKVWIVSDGHVFSDCIGVDDDVVSHYTNKLHQLCQSVAPKDVDSIGFCGLNDIFFTGVATKEFNPEWVKNVEVPHYTGSKICSISDVSRQILMKGCDTDTGTLREQVNTDGHPRLYLYRGFSRFMMEDLLLLPYFQDHSKKKLKKITSKIAFNMIKRNDAYSNLVELMFPHHIRLSIHAHTNSGPKFGIKVISEDQCRIVRDLNDLIEPKFEDLLHIPTPWHNCVVKVLYKNNSECLFLTKLQVIRNAITSGKFDGYWKDTCFEKGEGGHFVLNEL
ncbi:spore wall maturation protein Dit1p [Monosporozyma unispora]|nr:dityrosine synthesis enzyme [Kazachstania unispora]